MRRAPLLALVFLTTLSLSPLAGAQPAPPHRPQPAAAGGGAKPAAAKPKPKADAPTPAAAVGSIPDPQPPPPPPWNAGPSSSTSTSGESLIPAGAAATTPIAVPTTAPAQTGVPIDWAQEKLTRDNRFQMLEARVTADEMAANANAEKMAWLRMFKVSGFLQPQLLLQSFNAAGSPNNGTSGLPTGIGANDVIAKTNGTTTNPDVFRLRRARLKIEFMPTDYARVVMEIDPTSVGGPSPGIGTVARQVEAQGIARWSPLVTTELAMGIFKIPFGYEVLQSDADRPFIERSWGEQNMTPGEFDTGARAYTTWIRDTKRVDFQAAVVNGQTQGEPNFAIAPDLTKGKDLVGRVAFDLADWVGIGASGYYGQGQAVDPVGLRFKQFVRWAANGELAFHHTFSPKLGATRLFGEATYGQNMDRGVKYGFAVPSIPSTISSDVANLNEMNLWVRLEQDLTPWVTLGARVDQYTPDTSQTDDARVTFGVVGVLHFTKGLQAMLEYDHATDHVHAPGKAIPDRQIDTGSGVLQARF